MADNEENRRRVPSLRCAWVARQPFAAIDPEKKITDQPVEKIRFLKVHRVAGLRKNHQARRRNRILQKQRRLDAPLVLVADNNKRRNCEFPNSLFEVIERGTFALKTA